eukprot:7872248-Pyramimonas_sp.AAC.1
MEPIFAAADQGDLDALVECLKEDPKSLHSKNKDGWQPIHQAAYRCVVVGHAHIARIDSYHTFQHSDLIVLHIGRSGEVEIIAALLKAGAKCVNSCQMSLLKPAPSRNTTVVCNYSARGRGGKRPRWRVPPRRGPLDESEGTPKEASGREG